MQARLELVHEAAKGGVADKRHVPLLFVHGAYCGAWCWQQHFLPWFAARGYDCWAVSLEGHGESEGQDYLAAISIDDYVKNLHDAIQQIGTPPIVIGHSMGGFVLQQYLTTHTLPAAAFLASVPPTGLASSSLRLLTETPSLFLKLNMYQHGMYNPEFYELRSMLFSADAGDDVIEAMIQNFQPESDRAIMDMAFVNLLGIRPIPPLPALVLGGGEDALIPAEDVQATAQLLNVRAEILPNMGHMMMMDTRWQQVAERLLRWLEGLNIGAENSSHHPDAAAALA